VTLAHFKIAAVVIYIFLILAFSSTQANQILPEQRIGENEEGVKPPPDFVDMMENIILNIF
jgi:hypothetical protein